MSDQRVHADGGLPLRYYFDFNGIEDFKEYKFDANGIPRVDYGRPWGLQYNAITTAQYGLHNLSMWAQAQDEVHLRNAFAATDWLVKNCEELPNGGRGWVYRFDLDFYGPKAPWISAMAQGEAISLLLRAAQLRNEAVLLDTAKGAFRVFDRKVEDGGIQSAFPDGSPVFEEYPTDPAPHVLNGHIFALLGVYDFWKTTGDSGASDLFSLAVAGLKANIDRYDLGWWTYYDLHHSRRLSSRLYQKVHVQLAQILQRITGDTFFGDVADRWRGYLRNPACNLRWLLGKSMGKVRLAMRYTQS